MHVWALGLSCETPAALGPPGLHTTSRELQTCTSEGPGLKHHQFHERTLQRGRKNENGSGRRKKKREIQGSPPFGAPLFLGLGAPAFGTPAFATLWWDVPPPDGPHCFWVVVLFLILLRCCFSFCSFWPPTVDSPPPTFAVFGFRKC